MSPFFSIVLPVYNVEAYLERCVRSILKQSYSDYEIILVDDGSTDRSSVICDEFAQQYECIRVIHKENGGLSSARNEGLKAAEGVYIWFVDSDDWIEPEALEVLFRACCNKKHDIVKFGHCRVENGAKTQFSPERAEIFDSTEEMEALRRRAFCEPGRYVLSAWSHTYKTSFLNNQAIEFVSERVIGSEDYLFNLIALVRAGSVNVIDDVLYDYEQRSGSLTQQYKPDLAKRYAQLYRMLKDDRQKNEIMARYDAMIDRFYVWHLVFGTCICNEYCQSEQELSVARENVKKMLRDPAFCRAVKCCNCSGLSWKKRLLRIAMRLRIETVIYWMYKRNKRRKE